MRWLVAVSTLLGLLLAACGGTPQTGAGGQGPVDLGSFELGEPVPFRIKDTVQVCSDNLPYDIVQVTEAGERRVMLQHSCVGIVGRGIDQYCDNGQITIVDVIYCSDAISCEDQALDEEVVWDQQEFVEISEQCAGQTIHREVKEQVAPGEYRVVVSDWVDGHVETRVIAEFAIHAPGSD
jgi:hypothetical protein